MDSMKPIRRAAAVLLLIAPLAACGAGDDTSAAAAGEAQADTAPRRRTRQEALAEYRACIRTMTTTLSSAPDGSRDHINTNPSEVCQHLLSQAYREPAHARRRDPSDIGHSTPAVSP
jgi:hypothetical protein